MTDSTAISHAEFGRDTSNDEPLLDDDRHEGHRVGRLRLRMIPFANLDTQARKLGVLNEFRETMDSEMYPLQIEMDLSMSMSTSLPSQFPEIAQDRTAPAPSCMPRHASVSKLKVKYVVESTTTQVPAAELEVAICKSATAAVMRSCPKHTAIACDRMDETSQRVSAQTVLIDTCATSHSGVKHCAILETNLSLQTDCFAQDDSKMYQQIEEDMTHSLSYRSSTVLNTRYLSPSGDVPCQNCGNSFVPSVAMVVGAWIFVALYCKARAAFHKDAEPVASEQEAELHHDETKQMLSSEATTESEIKKDEDDVLVVQV